MRVILLWSQVFVTRYKFTGLSMVVYLQHKTIESVLKRGENLDNLVDKSNDLSSASQVQISLYINVLLI